MQRVKQTLLGPSELTSRQGWIILIICGTYIAYLPSRGFIDMISQNEKTDYLSTHFIVYGSVYVFGCLLNGIIIDRIGPKWSLIFSGILLCISVFSLAMINIEIINYIILAINAFSSSAIFPSFAKFIYIYFYPAQYDIVFILIALCGHIGALTTNFGINQLIESSSNTLLNLTYIAMFGTVIMSILSIVVNRDKDEKWFLAPLNVYDAANNRFDDEFCERQIVLNVNPKDINNKNEIIEMIESNDDDDDDKHEEDLEIRSLRVEMDGDRKSKYKPLLFIGSNNFLRKYYFIVISMCFLSLMNCLNVFSSSMLIALLPNISNLYHAEYELLSINSIRLMFEIGMICSLMMALFYRYITNESVYGEYKCSSCFIKLLVIISGILFIVICFIEISMIHPGTSPICLFLFDILFILYSISISYAIHVFCFVFLLSISGYYNNIAFVFGILHFFMFTISTLYTIGTQQLSQSFGWKSVSLLLFIFAILTNYFYQKLYNLTIKIQIFQTRKLLKIMKNNQLILNTKYSDISSNDNDDDNDNEIDVEIEDSYDDETDELYSQILLHLKHISIQIRALKKSTNLHSFSAYSNEERLNAISRSYDELIILLKELKECSPTWYDQLSENFEIRNNIKLCVRLEKMKDFKALYKKPPVYFSKFINSLNCYE